MSKIFYDERLFDSQANCSLSTSPTPNTGCPIVAAKRTTVLLLNKFAVVLPAISPDHSNLLELFNEYKGLHKIHLNSTET